MIFGDNSRLPDRFWSKVGRRDGCWIWLAGKNGEGYGNFGWYKRPRKSRSIKAHRLAYMQLVGPIPAGLELDHLCRNTSCVNPEHLEPVTHAENVRRGRGGQHWRDKTHCPQGHPYDAANTGIDRGSRFCRTCGNARRRAHYHANREAEIARVRKWQLSQIEGKR